MGRACIEGGKEDVAFINCEFDSGTIAHVELSWLAPSKLRRTTVVGSKKMVVYDDCSNEPVRVYDSGVMPREPESFGEYLKYRTGDIVSPHIEAVEPIALQMDDFCRAIRSGTTPRSSAQLGLDVVRMIEAAERLAQSATAPDSPCRSRRRRRSSPSGIDERPAATGDHGIRVLVLTNMYPTRGRAAFRLLRRGPGRRPAPSRRRCHGAGVRRALPQAPVLGARHRGFAGRCGATATTSCMPTTAFPARSPPSNSQRRS